MEELENKMEKIIEQHTHETYDGEENFSGDSVDTLGAAKSCAEIAKKTAIDFINWKGTRKAVDETAELIIKGIPSKELAAYLFDIFIKQYKP